MHMVEASVRSQLTSHTHTRHGVVQIIWSILFKWELVGVFTSERASEHTPRISCKQSFGDGCTGDFVGSQIWAKQKPFPLIHASTIWATLCKYPFMAISKREKGEKKNHKMRLTLTAIVNRLVSIRHVAIVFVFGALLRFSCTFLPFLREIN